MRRLSEGRPPPADVRDSTLGATGAPEVQAALSGVAARWPLADRLAAAVEQRLLRGDVPGICTRLFGFHPHRLRWQGTDWPARLAPLLWAGPERLPHPVTRADLPPLSDALWETLDRWLGWLAWRARRFPPFYRVWFPDTAQRLHLAAWDWQGTGPLTLTGARGALRVLSAPTPFDGDSYQFAAAVAHKLWSQDRRLAHPAVLTGGNDGEGVRPVEGYPAKAAQIARWQAWYGPLRAYGPPDAPAPFVCCDAIDAVPTRARRRSAHQTSIARIHKIEDVHGFFLDDALPRTRFVAGALDLDAWLDDPRQGAVALVTGPGGSGKSISILEAYLRHPWSFLLSLGVCPNEPAEVARWVATQLGKVGLRTLRKLGARGVVLFDGVDELAFGGVAPAARMQAVQAALPAQARQVFVARRDADVLDVVRGLRAPTRLEVQITLTDADLQAGGVHIPREGPVLALVRLAQASTVPEPIEQVAQVLALHPTPGITPERELARLEALAQVWLDTGREPPWPEDVGTHFVRRSERGGCAFRQQVYAELFAARAVLRQGQWPTWGHLRRWGGALRHVAAALAAQPNRWPDVTRDEVFAWAAWQAFEQRKDWHRWGNTHADFSVIEAAALWRDQRDLPAAAAALMTMVERPIAQLYLGRVLTESAAIAEADAVLTMEDAAPDVPQRADLLRAYALSARAECALWRGDAQRAVEQFAQVAAVMAQWGEDHWFASLRRINALIHAGDLRAAEVARDALGEVPLRPHAAFMAVIDARLGRPTTAPDLPYAAALHGWALTEHGGPATPVARRFEGMKRWLEAAHLYLRDGKVAEARRCMDTFQPALPEAGWRARRAEIDAHLHVGALRAAYQLLPPY